MNSRAKGIRGEKEWADWLAQNADCQLACRSGLNYVKAGVDVQFGIPGTRAEVKRVQTLNVSKAVFRAVADAKPDEIPYVAHRRNKEPWLVTLRAEDLVRFCFLVVANVQEEK